MKHASSRPVCVVIPVYRAELDRSESAALRQCVSILAAHPLIIIKPESLAIDSLLHEYPALRCESFPDRFFEGIKGYNQLMLSDELYARFERFDYVLIHQLDALVFADRLNDWCNRGYDYVGAPWIRDPVLPTWHSRLLFPLKRRVYRWVNRQARREPGMHYAQYAYSVGNGGFSLRRVAKMREVLAQLPAQADRYRRGDPAIHHEDLFFCVEANRFVTRVNTPGWREAAHFAWELQPSIAALLTKGELPFGCHGWNKLHRIEWQTIFSGAGLPTTDLLSF
jgi:hypothetical protein